MASVLWQYNLSVYSMRTLILEPSLEVQHEDLVARIIAFIRSTGTVPAEVAAHLSPETNIVRDLRLDSVAVMEFIMELEIEFDTIIPLNEIANIATIRDLANTIEPKRAPV